MSSNVAIVTGYSSGLGRAFTLGLLNRGWQVVGVSRAAKGPDWPAELQSAVHHISGSVAQDDTATRAFTKASEVGQLRIVINCAGQGVFGEVGSYTSEDISKAFEGNLAGLILFTDRAVSNLQETGGTIVNIMSTASKKLRVAESVYTAAKWAAKAYTRTVREAVKGKKLPIRIIEVYPCGMNTPFWSQAVRPVSDGAGFPAPEPIAEAVLQGVLATADSYQQEYTFERS